MVVAAQVPASQVLKTTLCWCDNVSIRKIKMITPQGGTEMSKAIRFAIKWTLIIGGYTLLLPLLILRDLVKMPE